MQSDLDEALWLCLIYYYFCFQRDLRNCGFCFSFGRSSWQTGRIGWLGEKYAGMCIHVCKRGQCVIWLHNICYLNWYICRKKKVGIWSCLAACKYYFSIHALRHKIKIGKSFFLQDKDRRTVLRLMLLKFHNQCFTCSSAEITKKETSGIFPSISYCGPAWHI